MKYKQLSTICPLILIFVCLGIGCVPDKHRQGSENPFLVRLSPRQYPHFSDSRNFADLSRSIHASMEYFSRLPEHRIFTYGKDVYTVSHLIKSLETFDAFLMGHPSPEKMDHFIAEHFIVYESTGNADHQVLFTGYFEPIYKGSLVQDKSHIYPLYPLPEDLLTIDLSLFSDQYKGQKKLIGRVEDRQVQPYFSRKTINTMENFADRARPIVWLENRVDRFFLEIQGSGRIRLPDGSFLRVHYAGSNGNAYHSVGRYLIGKGEIAKEDMSMQAIRAWLENHPGRMDEILHHNKSFVFFQMEDGGPYGSIGVELTPLRSIALDQGIFPRGALCFAMTALPDPDSLLPRDQWEEASLFLMHQDTGGAIKGPGRGDIFCGNGEFAEFAAGNMNIPGRLFFLVLDPDASVPGH